ncbi:hypothetical protein ACFLZO_01025, partial [Patescibacteria group bacterium]
MEKNRSRVGQLVRWHARKGQTYVRNVSIDLDEKTESRFGQIFGIFETETDSRTADALIAHIEDAMVRAVNEAMKKDATKTREEIFEAAVYRANHAVSRLLDDRGLPLDPRKIKSVIVAQKGFDVIMGIWGSPSALLFHPSTKNDTVRVFNLLEDKRPDHEKPVHQRSNRRGYTNVITGGIGKRDRLLVSTENPREFMSDEQMIATVTPHDPQGAAEALKEALSSLTPRLSFASLVIDAIDEQAIAYEAPPEVMSGTQGSIDALLKTTNKTRDILSPSLITGVWRRMSGGFNTIVNDIHGKRMKKDVSKENREDMSDTADPSISGNTGDGIGNDLPPPHTPPSALSEAAPDEHDKSSLTDVLRRGIALVAALKDKKGRKRSWYSARRKTRRWIESYIEKYNGLTKKRRVILLATLAVMFFLNQSVAFADWQKQSDERVATYEKSVLSIDQKIDSAEASIIYHDQERATVLLDEAELLIMGLPQKNEAQEEQATRLTMRIDDKRGELRRAVPLESPEVIATIVANGGEPALRRMTVRNDMLWSLSEEGDVYKTILTESLTEKAGAAPEGTPSFLLTGTSSVFAGTDDGGITAITFSSNNTSDLSIDFGDTDPSLEDADVYGPRLYVLDAAHNRILKHSPIKGGFDEPSLYLKDGTDVSNAVSMSIDGAVYILSDDGNVTKLLKGMREDYGVQATDPPVTSAKKLRTMEDSETLYVLDTAPGRIITFSKKTGALLAQYTSGLSYNR